MASGEPIPTNVQLRYASASIFDRADTRAQEVGRLAPGDPVTVLGTESDFYRVQLPDGTTGFVYAHNLIGSDMPLTANEQAESDRQATIAAQRPSGLRGMLHRLRGGT
jgi:hypothetical protein